MVESNLDDFLKNVFVKEGNECKYTFKDRIKDKISSAGEYVRNKVNDFVYYTFIKHLIG
jgi:hypothetical protein